MTSGTQQQGSQDHTTLTVMIDKKPTYCFYFQCTQQATVYDLLQQLQKYYYDCIHQKGLFRDQSCTSKVSSNESVTKQLKLYLDLTSQEYEAQIKKLFAGDNQQQKESTKVESALEHGGKMKEGNSEEKKEENIQAETNGIVAQAPYELPIEGSQSQEGEIQPLVNYNQPQHQHNQVNPQQIYAQVQQTPLQTPQTQHQPLPPLSQQVEQYNRSLQTTTSDSCCNLI